MYKTTDPKYEILYAATSFLSPLQSNDLSEAEKKLAREYLKEETKKLETFNQAAEENEDAQEAEEKQDEAVYIPGAGRLGRLNNRDLRRLNKEGEFETRSVLFFGVQHILFGCSTDLQQTLIASRRTPSML